MIVLEAHGIDPGYVRGQSMERLNELLHAIAKLKRRNLADVLVVHTLAAAAGAGSEEAVDSIEELMAQLAPDEGSIAHLTNPDAQTDWDALRQFAGDPEQRSVAVQRVKKEPTP